METGAGNLNVSRLVMLIRRVRGTAAIRRITKEGWGQKNGEIDICRGILRKPHHSHSIVPGGFEVMS